MSFVVTVRLRVRPGRESAFLTLVRENARASLSGEPGCRRFDVCLAPERPGEVFLYEIYDDAEAFEAHKAARHYLDFDAAAAPMLAAKAVGTYRLEEGDP